MTEVIDILDDEHKTNEPEFSQADPVTRSGQARTDGTTGKAGVGPDDLANLSRVVGTIPEATALLLRTACRHGVVSRPGGPTVIGDTRLNLGMALRKLPTSDAEIDWRPAPEPSFETPERSAIWALLTRLGRTVAPRTFEIEGVKGTASWYVDQTGLRALSTDDDMTALHDLLRRTVEANAPLRYRIRPAGAAPAGAPAGPAALLGYDGTSAAIRFDRSCWPVALPGSMTFVQLRDAVRLASAVTHWAADDGKTWFQLRGRDRRAIMTGRATEDGFSIDGIPADDSSGKAE